MNSFSCDVLALGNTAVDDLLYVPRFPVPDAKQRVLHSLRQCGGLAATAVVAAARLGTRCAYAGALGEDELSQFVRSTLQGEGVDVAHVAVRGDAAPVHSVIVVGQENATRNIFYEVVGRNGAADDAPTEEVVRGARVLLVDPWGATGMVRAAHLAREAGNEVVADIERDDFAEFDELSALSNHLILSQEFALRRTGASTPSAAAAALWNNERSAVVVTCGADGACGLCAEYSAPRHFAAFAVPAVDTTGCGDVFHGAYAAALADDLPFEERVRFASAAAALKATRHGGQSGIPSRREVEKILKTTTP